MPSKARKAHQVVLLLLSPLMKNGTGHRLLELGNATRNSSSWAPTYAGVRSATLQVADAAVSSVHQIAFDQKAIRRSSRRRRSDASMAVVTGPRVKLYDNTSNLYRRLNNKSDSGHIQLHDGADDDKGSRQVPMMSGGGGMATCVAIRHDGRLLAIGTHRGQVRVVDLQNAPCYSGDI